MPDCWELDPTGARLEQPETKAEERLFMVHMEVGKVRPVPGRGGSGAEGSSRGAGSRAEAEHSWNCTTWLLPEIYLLLAGKRLAKLLRFSVPQVPHLQKWKTLSNSIWHLIQ